MRFFYADPGLVSDLGHHANSCRFITRELRARGIDTTVLAFVEVTEELREELGAIPFFRTYTYWSTDGDPICGWLNGFHGGAEATARDLGRLSDITSSDVVYLNSARPPQVLGLVHWILRLPPESRPSVLLEFGTEPGVELRVDEQGPILGLPDLRDDPRAVLYRFATRNLRDGELPRFHLATFDPDSSSTYAALLDVEVAVLPFPHHSPTPPQSRVGRRPVTVAVLGHQRQEKGYHLVPEIARRLLGRRDDVRLLVHNGAPDVMRQTQEEMRAIAQNDERVILDERTANDVLWAELLSASDMIVCPYDQQRFAASYSAVAVEAIAYAIPLVVPAETSLARLLMDAGEPGTIFPVSEPESICEAIERALDRYDDIAGRAFMAAGMWDRNNGPRPVVDAMLDLLTRP